MAANCPQCSQVIDQDFGVAACLNCGAVVFIDMDGNATLSEATNPPEPNYSEPPQQEAEEQAPEQSFEQSYETASEPAPLLPQEGAQETHQEEANSEYRDIIDDPPSIQQESAHAEQDQIPSLDPAIENEFATGEFVSVETSPGPLMYQVIIEEIDTKNLRTEVKLALSDPKFMWNVSELMDSIKNGKIAISDLNPVKASMVVQKLREVPVKVSWSQSAYK